MSFRADWNLKYHRSPPSYLANHLGFRLPMISPSPLKSVLTLKVPGALVRPDVNISDSSQPHWCSECCLGHILRLQPDLMIRALQVNTAEYLWPLQTAPSLRGTVYCALWRLLIGQLLRKTILISCRKPYISGSTEAASLSSCLFAGALNALHNLTMNNTKQLFPRKPSLNEIALPIRQLT